MRARAIVCIVCFLLCLPSALAQADEATSATTGTAEEAALAAELAAQLDTASSTETGVGTSVGGTARLRLIDISALFSAAAGGSNLSDGRMAAWQVGAEDPAGNSVSLQSVELVLAGAVDPYLRIDAKITIGEEGIEVEEGYFSTLALPAGFKVRAGRFLTPFGRENQRHSHQWQTVNKNLATGYLFGGDGLRGDGVEVSWLPALPWYMLIIGAIQNGAGEAAGPFYGTGDAVAGAVEPSVTRPWWQRNFGTLRILQSFDLGEETSMNIGLSGSGGANRAGRDRSSFLAGADLYLKWKPLANDHGWPYLALQAEWIERVVDTDRYGALRDRGVYAEVVWGFVRRWSLGARADFTAALNHRSLSSGRPTRERYSAMLTYKPTEFSRLRWQYDLSPRLYGGAQAVWMQISGIIGFHPAHIF